MASLTHKHILKNILENLTEKNFEKFRSELLDRGVVRTNQVENKNFLVVTDVMVEAYTERRVLQEAEDILRDTNCKQAADKLAEEAKKAGLGTADPDPAPVPVPAPVAVVFPQQADEASNASLSDDIDLR